MSSHEEIQKAYLDYQSGVFGLPWDHKISDEAWLEVCRQKGQGSRQVSEPAEEE